MEILPTLNFVAFIANLIDLKQFNTILVLHDHSNRNQINFLVESLQPRNDVTWMLINEYKNPESWIHPSTRDENTLILTALQKETIASLLMQLYNRRKLNKHSKNLIVLSGISKFPIKTLPFTSWHEQINAVFIDWKLVEIKIYAWNPNCAEKSILLSGTEFLGASNGGSLNRKYSAIFFNQLHSMYGEPTNISTIYDGKNMYNVISKGSAACIDGKVIRIADMIGDALQSPLEFFVMKLSAIYIHKTTTVYTDFLERTYQIFATVPMRKIQMITATELAR